MAANVDEPHPLAVTDCAESPPGAAWIHLGDILAIDAYLTLAWRLASSNGDGPPLGAACPVGSTAIACYLSAAIALGARRSVANSAAR